MRGKSFKSNHIYSLTQTDTKSAELSEWITELLKHSISSKSRGRVKGEWEHYVTQILLY